MEMRPPLGPGIAHPSQLQHHHQVIPPQHQPPQQIQTQLPAYFSQQQQQQSQQLQQQLQQNQPVVPAIRERTGTGSGSYGFLPSFTDQPESRHGRPRKYAKL